jgi:hypothetical protein
MLTVETVPHDHKRFKPSEILPLINRALGYEVTDRTFRRYRGWACVPKRCSYSELEMNQIILFAQLKDRANSIATARNQLLEILETQNDDQQKSANGGTESNPREVWETVEC